MDRIEGYLEVGRNDEGEVIVNHPDLKSDDNGCGHIVFSPDQARYLAALLVEQAALAQRELRERVEEERRKLAESIPVDRSACVLADGSPVTPEHREINSATGQQKGYVVLTAEERAKGFVRPVRRSYVHKVCGSVTTMGLAIAETYARDPGFYGGTFCCNCREHRPLTEFVWEGTGEQVGS